MKQYPAKETRYYRDFREFLETIADRYQEKTAITTYHKGADRQDWSYRQLYEDSIAFAKALIASGLGKEHIAIVSENCYEWLTSYFGIVLTGGIACCIDIEHSDDTVAEMVEKADVKALICSAGLAKLCLSIKETNPMLQEVILIQGDSDQGGIPYEAFVKLGENPEAEKKLSETTLEGSQTAAIVYTSGTTSTAKPVMLSQKAILWNAADSLTILDSRDRVFNSLPLYHTYGFTCGILCPLMRGLDVGISSDLKRMIQEMTLFRPQMLVAVPLIIEVVYKILWGILEKADKKQKIQKMIRLEGAIHRTISMVAPEVKPVLQGTCLADLDVILSGGAYLDERVAEELLHLGIVVLQGYGVTECSPSISCNRNEDFSLDSVGMVLPGNEVRIVEDEIQVRGYALMNGYYKEPELTAEAFDDGWFKTGDLGYLDKRGHLHITGRKKNLIVMKNGKKVAVEEMENQLRRMPLIREVMVYGALSGASTDDVKIAASVYPDPDQTAGMSNYEILQKLQVYVDEMNQGLPTYKQIQMLNIRETDFERTASRKVKRQ